MSVGPDKLEELQKRLLDLGVQEDDLEEQFIRAGGPGGQKINKTSVAVRLRHVPSGVEVRVQESRSQAMNRFLARRRLAEELEARRDGRRREREQRIAKIRRQKRKRSKRAKEKVLEAKHRRSETKGRRKKVQVEE